MKTAEQILKRTVLDQFNSLYKVSLDDMNWFVEQSNKVRELEERVSKLTLALDICKMESGLGLSLERYISRRGLSYSDSLETLIEALAKDS